VKSGSASWRADTLTLIRSGLLWVERQLTNWAHAVRRIRSPSSMP
jgi:hypothetical protein